MYDDTNRINQMELETVAERNAGEFYRLIATVWDDSVGESGEPIQISCPHDSLPGLLTNMLSMAMDLDNEAEDQYLMYTNVLRVALRDMKIEAGIELGISFPSFIIPDFAE